MQTKYTRPINTIENLKREIDQHHDFECYVINILDSQEMTDTEKLQLIKKQL